MTDPEKTAGLLATEAEHVVRQIEPLLAGKHHMLQSAVLADLLATWLAGHFVPDDREQTTQLRKQLLQDHLTLVGLLIPFNEREIAEETHS